MKALFLSCTLKAFPAPSNTEALSQVMVRQFEADGITSEIIRLADYNVKPGVSSDEGEGDDWPFIRAKIIAADILIMATPTWLGQHSSLCQRALERMDAMLSETQADGRPIAFDKVGGIVVTGNEDGAHHIVACVSQMLIDIGFTMPANCWTYWHLGPGPGPDYTHTDQAHDYSDRLACNAARNIASMARALKANPLPQQESAS